MEPKCKQPNCTMPKGRALGYCNAHYTRRARGKPMDAPIRNAWATDDERFWAKVDKSGTCWLWTGAKLNGYGVFRIDGGAQIAHRVSYKWAKGEIPEGVQLDHKCHNRSCINPDHLRFADHALNGQNRASANKNSKSGVRGVYWNADRKGWFAAVTIAETVHREGPFEDVHAAERAAIGMRRELMPYSLMDQRKVT